MLSCALKESIMTLLQAPANITVESHPWQLHRFGINMDLWGVWLVCSSPEMC